MPIRGRIVGRLRRLIGLVVSCLGLLLAASPAASADESATAWLFDPDAVVEIDFGGLSQEEFDALEAEPDEYVPVTFAARFGDTVLELPGEVGLRLKGEASFRPLTKKAAFKVKFDEYVEDQTFFGLERLTLNNMVQDPSMIHETLTYGLFGAMGLPASRTGYAFVRVNELVYGVYLNVETLDEISLPNWFGSTQHLYEADKKPLDVNPGAAEEFEVDVGDEEDLGDLEALIAAANDEQGDWSDGMAAVAGLQQMTRHWAIERYVGHWDGYAGRVGKNQPANYYLHGDDAGIFSMLPWGTDQTWQLPPTDSTRYLEFDEEAGGLMFNRCFADESCREMYAEALRELHCIVVPSLDLDSRATEIYGLLAPYQALEDEGRREYTPAEIEEGVQETRASIAARQGELAGWLGGGDPCSFPAPGADPAPGTAEPPTRRLWIGKSRAKGKTVVTRLNAPGPGLAVQRVLATFDGRRRAVCADWRRAREAGPLRLRCRLSKRARRRLQSGPLKLRVRVGFSPPGDQPRFATRGLTLAGGT